MESYTTANGKGITDAVAADEESFFCGVCEMNCANAEAYKEHLASLLHTENSMMQTHIDDDKSDKEEVEEDEKMETEGGKDETPKEEVKKVAKFDKAYHCETCSTYCTDKDSWRKHIEGLRHKKNVRNRKSGAPLTKKKPQQKPFVKVLHLKPRLDACKDAIVGLKHVTEYQKEGAPYETRYVCDLCECRCDPNMMMSHLIAYRHRYNYVRYNHADLFNDLSDKETGRSFKKPEQIRILEDQAKQLELKEGRGAMKIHVERDPFLNENQVRAAAAEKRAFREQNEPAAKRLMLDGGGFRGRGRGGPGFGPGGPQLRRVEPTMWEMIFRLNESNVEVCNPGQAAMALQLSNALSQTLLAFNRDSVNKGQEVEMREQMLRNQEAFMEERLWNQMQGSGFGRGANRGMSPGRGNVGGWGDGGRGGYRRGSFQGGARSGGPSMRGGNRGR